MTPVTPCRMAKLFAFTVAATLLALLCGGALAAVSESGRDPDANQSGQSELQILSVALADGAQPPPEPVGSAEAISELCRVCDAPVVGVAGRLGAAHRRAATKNIVLLL